jgi:hypothetical protein
MDYLHEELDLSAGDVVEVALDKQANVRLRDATNFDRYRRGEPYRYHGGLATESPFEVAAPHAGQWHLVVDLRGFAGTVRASFRVLEGAM